MIVDENDVSLQLKVMLSQQPTQEVSVSYSTADGTTTANRDYRSLNQVVLTFATTDPLEKTISIEIIDDELYEPLPETFRVQFSYLKNAVFENGTDFVTVRIRDNDTSPILSIDSASNVSENAQTVEFTVNLTPASGQQVIVFWQTSDGTAVMSEDYISARGILTFPPSLSVHPVQQRKITVSLIDDMMFEGDESFEVGLYRVLGIDLPQGVMGVKGALTTITDDESKPLSLMASPRNRSVKLTWNDPGNSSITKYQIEQDGTGVWTDIPGSGATTTSHTVTGLSNGKTYSFAIRAVNAGGSSPPSDQISVVIEVEESFTDMNPLNNSILPAFGKATISGSIDAMTMRIDQALRWRSLGSDIFTFSKRKDLHSALESDVWNTQEEYEIMELGQVLGGSAFVLEVGVSPHNKKLGEDAPVKQPEIEEKPFVAETEGGFPAVWGSVDYGNMSGGDNLLVDWDGDILNGYVGVDTKLSSDILMGLSLSLSRGNFDYRYNTPGEEGVEGEYDIGMKSVYPYMAWSFAPDAYMWIMAGYGRGKIEINGALLEDEQSSDVSLKSTMVGVRGNLLMHGVTAVAFKGEALQMWMDVEGNDEFIEELSLDSRRVRLSVEGSYLHRFATGVFVEPLLEVGMRYDGGDGETGTGLEVGAGFVYSDLGIGLSVSGKGRWLALYEGDLEEWGFSCNISFDSDADKRGILFSLMPRWGETQSGVESMWDRGVNGLLVNNAGANVETELAYGISALGGEGVLIPYGSVMLEERGRQHYRLGSRLEMDSSTSVSLETERRERDAEEVVYSLILKGSKSF